MDSELRVHGARNRIADAFIIPIIPAYRIQNAVYMIGEKITKNNILYLTFVLTGYGADIIKTAYPDLYK